MQEVGADGDLDGVREAEQAHCLLSFLGVASFPNWPTKAGATQAMTRRPVDGLDELEDLALVRDGGEGQFTRHMPQETHLLKSIWRGRARRSRWRPCRRPWAQGRSMRLMAL